MTSRGKNVLFAVCIVVFLLLVGYQLSRPNVALDTSLYTRSAVDFPKGLPWLNVTEPLTLQDLRGRVVILDFWTYGCVNCIHVIPALHALEKKYGNKLVVIGVHTPKFDNEKNINTLKAIVTRYELHHPIIQDVGYKTWNAYGVSAWPTLVVINAEGKIVGSIIGDGQDEALSKLVERAMKMHANEIKNTALDKIKIDKTVDNSFLRAPGKVTVNKKWLVISDTLNNRIVVSNHQGKVISIIGGKDEGNRDGDFKKARFNKPQGVVIVNNGIYVADTENHLIRHIDMDKKVVTTIAGNGKRAWLAAFADNPKTISLNSPWALAYQAPYLYIAMAGNHQIWWLNLNNNHLRPYAGNGREGLKDGAIGSSEFSQPSGLSIVGHWLFVADAEDSAVRRVNLDTDIVYTLVGKGLFVFGDRDGPLKDALIQHDLGIAAIDPKHLYIADTYNHKIKYIDLNSQIILSMIGTGKPENGVGRANLAGLNEPGGIAWYKAKLYIADTNNNRIVVFDPKKNLLTELDVSE